MGAKLGGGGSSRFDLGQNSDINVTPFVDVMLVLLIIFMVAIPPATTSIKLDLPPAIPPPPGTKVKEPILIRSQEHTSELHCPDPLVFRLLLDNLLQPLNWGDLSF